MDTEADLTPEEEEALNGNASDDINVSNPLDNSEAKNTETPDDNSEKPKEPDGKKQEQHMVPHGALHAEREERKKAQADAAEAHAKFARMQERFKIAQEQAQQEMQSTFAQQNNQQSEPPLPDKDFVGYVRWLEANKQAQDEAQFYEQIAQQYAVKQAQQAENIVEYFKTSVDVAKGQCPDFDEAANFLYETRVNQLKALQAAYPAFADENTINKQIGSELNAIAIGAIQSGANPAEIIYNYAKSAGYVPKQPDASKDIADMQAQQTAARTLTSSNGSTVADPVSLEAIDKMSEQEFAAWIANPRNEKAFNLLMQGQ